MNLLDQLSEEFIQQYLENLESFWLANAMPGEENETEELEPCPNCGANQCQIITTVQAIRDDLCTGRFDLRCALCGFSGVIYGRVYEPGFQPEGDTLGQVSLTPYHSS